jgi:RecA/RadA recombinase
MKNTISLNTTLGKKFLKYIKNTMNDFKRENNTDTDFYMSLADILKTKTVTLINSGSVYKIISHR